MQKLRLFLIPWMLFLTSYQIKAQKPEFPNLKTSSQTLVQQSHRPLFELIPPLEGFHALHRAIAITPPTIDPFAVLRVTPSPIFNHNNKFITVTVPNPLYQPSSSSEISNPIPVVVIPPIVNDKKVADTKKEPLKILETLPKALSATLFNGPKDDSPTEGFESGSKSSVSTSNLSDINITELNEEIGNLQSSEQSEEVNLAATQPTTVITTPTATEATPSTSTSTSIAPPTPLFRSTTSESLAKINNTGSIFHLSEQLENKKIESFLAATNISTNEAHNFLMLVEKVLEEEVHKRLQQHVEETHKTPARTTTTPPTTVTITETSPTTTVLTTTGNADVQPSLDISEPVKLVNEESVASNPIRRIQEKLEVKTVDTRLSYGSGSDEESDVEDYESSLQPSSEVDLPDEQRNYNLTQDFEKPVLAIREHIMPLPKAASSNSRDVQIRNPVVQAGVLTEDFKEREQAEFDSIFGRDELSDFQVPEKTNIQTTTTPPWKNTFAPVKYTHSGARPPMTQFERLVKDYQFRLSGQNGFDDLIKALRNAKIGIPRASATGKRTEQFQVFWNKFPPPTILTFALSKKEQELKLLHIVIK